jgi:hypothetical protein
VKVFISYRRDDSRHAAGRLRDRLRAEGSGIREVFLDTEDIPGGGQWRQHLADQMATSDACLVLIGGLWRGPRQDRIDRIDEPGDVVRNEVATALRQRGIVVPVLVDGASAPWKEPLPEGLETLGEHNARPLRHDTFGDDADRIVEDLTGKRPIGRSKPFQSVMTGLLRMLVGIVITAMLVLVAAEIIDRTTGLRLSMLFDGNAEDPTNILFGLIAIAGGVAAAFFWPRRGKRR